MSMESPADRLALLEFDGELATYTPSGGAAAPVQVLYDAPYVGAANMESRLPQALARTDDLTGEINGGTLLVAAGLFNIINNEPDSTGMTTLILEAT